MKKAVWITFFVALIAVNLFAEAGNYFLGVNIEMFYRLTLVLGITVGAAAFTGAALLIKKLEEERPLSGHVRDTLGYDRRGSAGDTSLPHRQGDTDSNTTSADKQNDSKEQAQ